MPPLIGLLGGLVGLRQGMFLLYAALGYILSISLWARPLIANETIAMKKKREAEA
jgi:FHS family L-fucose permease-like MFS transporter